MTSAADLVLTFSNIVKNNPQLAYLSKSIKHGQLTPKGFIYDNSYNYGTDAYYTASWIRICRLNKPALTRYGKWVYHEQTRDNRSKFLSLFNKLNNNYSSPFRSSITRISELMFAGINIDKDLKIAGYSFNICDVINTYYVYNDNNNRDEWMDAMTNYIYKMIYIGEKNYVIGFIDSQAVLYLDEVLLAKLKDALSEENFTEIVTKIMSVYANANCLFFSLNTLDFKTLLTDRITQMLTTQLVRMSDDCTVIKPEHIDIFDDYSAVNGLITKIKEVVDRLISTFTEHTNWGVNSQYSYKQLIDSVIASQNEGIQKKIEAAFNKGMVFGNKVETCGWSVSDKDFGNTVAWEKDVEIVPVRFYYNNKCYKINNNDPNWKNPFKITKLYVTSEGKMFCEGFHPNTSHGNVCMGDIAGKIVMSDIKKLQQNLTRCESLLYTINYDSPYDSSKRDELIHHSVPEDSQEFDDQFVSTGEIIQEVNFEDEEEDNVSEEYQASPDDTIGVEVLQND